MSMDISSSVGIRVHKLWVLLMAAIARCVSARLSSFLAEPKRGLNRCFRVQCLPCAAEAGLSDVVLRCRRRPENIVLALALKQRRFVAQAASTSSRAAGTWDEKNINEWAVSRLKELLLSVEPLTFREGSAYFTDVVRCTGDAALISIRGRRRIDYSFDIVMDFQGKIEVGEPEASEIEGTLAVDAYYGEGDLQLDVKFTEAPYSERDWLRDQMSEFVPRIKDKLLCFENELRELSLQ